ncbi:hypothetical protein SAMD00023353_4800690 [Rosellinia necatrix]|uniref:Uncharacterized protein n=1 Tax=Rosellinia necatrix TaxID=77044 RepID=A0A1W2TQA3_ROSNE|nr:hypothetical protein SAMD00023353_4800690 [Rosellinia necatrix]
MDGLSVAASVVGLLTAANEIVKLLGPYISASRATPPIAVHVRDETETTRVVLVGLQALVREFPAGVSRGGALVGVDQLVTILTGGVLLFAELEGAVRGLAAAPSRGAPADQEAREPLLSTHRQLPLRSRVQWARHEKSLADLLSRLQGFKVSVTAILTLLRCDSDRRAELLQTELAVSISTLLEKNRDLSRRIVHLEGVVDAGTIRSRNRQTIVSELTMRSGVRGAIAARSSSSQREEMPGSDPLPRDVPDPRPRSLFEFERDLVASRVYRRVKRDTMDFSFRSSVSRANDWSILSGLSLADISALSVIALPLDLQDVVNRRHYVDNSDQPLDTVIEEASTPNPNDQLQNQGSIFHGCLRIHAQLVQIPGFQELFDREWIAQRGEWDMDASSITSEKDEELRLWQRRDVFKALKNILQEDFAYGLLIKEFGRDLDEPDPPSWGFRGVFWQLCVDLGFDDQDLFHLKGPILGNVHFLKVLACVGKALDRLVRDGIINPVDEQHPNTIRSGLGELNPIPASAYRRVLVTFIDTQRKFIKDLLSHITELEEARDSSKLMADQLRISVRFFLSYAHYEIEILLFVERMLMTPIQRHLWAGIILRWSAMEEIYSCWEIIDEKNARFIFHYRDGVKKCLKLLLLPSQRLHATAQFFQKILDIWQRDNTGIGTVSPVQKNNLIVGNEVLKSVLKAAGEKMARAELSDTLFDLNTRCKEYGEYEIGKLGWLIQAGSSGSKTGLNNRATEVYPPHEIYLFEKALLCLVKRKPTAEIRRQSFEPHKTAEAANVINTPSSLQPISRIPVKDIRDVIVAST